MKTKFEVRIMWRRKGQHKRRIIYADSIEHARNIAFKKFGPNRGVRPCKPKGWRPNSLGYTPNIIEAGKYTFQAATAIVTSANKYSAGNTPKEALVPDYTQDYLKRNER